MEDEWKRPAEDASSEPQNVWNAEPKPEEPQPTAAEEHHVSESDTEQLQEDVPQTTVFKDDKEAEEKLEGTQRENQSTEARREHTQSEIGKEEKNVRGEKSMSTTHKSDWFWKVTTIVLIGLLAFFVFRGGSGDNAPTGQVVADIPTAANPAAAAPAPTPTVADVDIDDDAILGEEDAPVTIIEFSDYQCPYCGRFFRETLPQIKSKYIDTGKVRLIFRDFPLSFHPNAEPAAIAANCAGEQGKYYEFHDKIFENQASLSDASYRQWAEELGLDVAAWEACREDPDQRAEVRKDFLDGQNAGVRGTPAFFINGKLVSGAQPYSVFEQLIEAELSK
jgi:protein-disulfide isomerase